MNTAVEWLVDQLTSIGQLEIPQGSNAVKSIINEAKEMEKEQMIEFASNCIHRNSCFFNTEKYYNQTFKQQEQ
jgi:hypothetical protein